MQVLEAIIRSLLSLPLSRLSYFDYQSILGLMCLGSPPPNGEVL
jgi:hypothetical protein